MANYRRGTFDLTVDSNFRPFSFQEMLAPLAIYDKAYGEMEDDFLKQQKEVDTLKYLADTLPEKSEAREIYDNYVNDLQDALSDFGNSKLNPITANKLLNLKRRSGDLIKLKQIATIRDNQIKAQDAALAKDPTLILSRDARDTSFDEYMNNPDIGYKSYSGALIASQVADATSQLSKELTDLVQNRPTPVLTSLEQQYGLKATDIAFALRHPESENANKLLKLILDNVIEASGIREWGDPYALEKALDWGRTSFWKAIGQDKASGYNMPRAAVTRIKQATENPTDKLLPPPSGFNGSKTSKDNTTKKVPKRGGEPNNYSFGGDMNEYSPKNIFAGGGRYKLSDALKQYYDSMNKDEKEEFLANEVFKLKDDEDWPAPEVQDSLMKAYDLDYQNKVKNYVYYKQREAYDKLYPELDVNAKPFYTEDESMAIQKGEYPALAELYTHTKKTPKGNWALDKDLYNKIKHYAELKDMTYPSDPKGVWANNLAVDYIKPEIMTLLEKNNLQALIEGKTGPNQSKIVENLRKQYENSYDAWETKYYRTAVPGSFLTHLQVLLDNPELHTDNGVFNSYEIIRDEKTKKAALNKTTVKIKPAQNGSDTSKQYVPTTAHVIASPIGNYLYTRINGQIARIPFALINKTADDMANSAFERAKHYRQFGADLVDNPVDKNKPIAADQLVRKYIIDAQKALLKSLAPTDPGTKKLK